VNLDHLLRAVGLILATVSLLLMTACSNEPETGPGEVRWDRETCERCVMTLSDPNSSAQIRGGPEGEVQKLIKFDDLGCAVIWLDQQSWKDNPQIEIWVNQYQTGDWIDARQAYYVKNQLTPMNYGLGAQLEAAPDALSFAEAREHIYKVEEELNLHGGALHLTPPLSPETNTETTQ
jgi:copper chaperone NosL